MPVIDAITGTAYRLSVSDRRTRSRIWAAIFLALFAFYASLALLILGPTPAEAATVERPPAEFISSDAMTVRVYFVPDVQKACEAWGRYGSITGCANPLTGALILPLPCRYRGEFADLTCHELGHLLGWRHAQPLLLSLDRLF